MTTPMLNMPLQCRSPIGPSGPTYTWITYINPTTSLNLTKLMDTEVTTTRVNGTLPYLID